jgi:mannose-1-phosphate guanylyltransferase
MIEIEYSLIFQSVYMSTVVHVILSGSAPGILSREQFMLTYSGKSLFQLCVERNASFADRQLVVGRHDYYIQARDYFKLTGNKTYLNIIEEDHFTNLYSISFAAFSASAEEILLITPSNYLISNEAAYKKALEKMILIAEKGKISVLSFHSEEASNSGILCCKAGVYLQELKICAPEVYQVAMKAWEARVAQYVAVDITIKMPPATVENTLLPVSDKVKVVVEAAAKLQMVAS